MHNCNIFSTRTNQWHTWIHKIHKIHHDLELGKPTPSPLYFFCGWARGLHSNVIYPKTLKLGVSKFPKLGLPPFWRLITSCVDFQLRRVLKKSCSPCWKLFNDMWRATYTHVFQVNSWFLVVGIKLTLWFPAFFSTKTCVVSTQMDHVSPFLIFTCQGFSNDIMNYSIPWILTFQIALWRFKSPLGLQLPKWELTWECVGLFPNTLFHS